MIFPAHRRHLIAALALLALVTVLLYHDALGASWRADDGSHLGFVAWYAPWQYFFIPEVTREFSTANVTPWNPFTYSVNLALFGLRPAGFYAHQLASLWLAAVATLGLLRLWLPLRWALFGALLFLVAAPSAHIANELMTGHYLEGLVFAIAAAWCFVMALRKDSWRYALGGAAFYLLATTCKEIYVPLPAMLLLLPEADWRRRVRFLLPFGGVGVAYLGWRFVVLGRLLGGYGPGQPADGQAGALQQLAGIPFLLFGQGALGYLALACAAMLAGWTLARQPRWAPFVAVAAVMVIAPLVPLTAFPGIAFADRYLFLVWWLAAALLAAALASGAVPRRVSAAAALVILAGVSLHGRTELALLRQLHAPYEAYLRFAVTSSENDVLLVPANNRHYIRTILNGIVDAERSRHPDAPLRSRRFVDEQLLPLIDTSALRVFRYDPQCLCLQQLPADASRPPADAVARLRDRNFVVDVLPLAPPYREIREIRASGGQVESIEVTGRGVTLQGRAPLRDDSLERWVIVGTPVMPTAREVEPVPYSGFRIKLQYASDADAARAGAALCVVAGSDRTAMTLLDNPKNPGCA
ncbi:MAG: hypothetical protein ACAH21_16465, partial [Ramlibacter sp.]